MTKPEAHRLQRVGFRKWYERQLVDGHISLVTAFLCVIAIACGAELVSIKDQSIGIIGNAVLIFGSAVIGWAAIKRYQRVLVEAEWMGEQANCGGCGRYGFSMTKDHLLQPSHDKWMIKAHCKKCAHQWDIEVDVTRGSRAR